MSAAARRLYDLHVRALPREAQLELLAIIAREAGQERVPATTRLRDLAGLGREVWEGVEADAYVRGLRDEWARRS